MKGQVSIKHALLIGGFVIFLYVICLVWRVTLTDPAAMAFHLTALKVAFPGFAGYDGLSIIWGGFLSGLYGFLASLIFHSLHQNCCEPKK